MENNKLHFSSTSLLKESSSALIMWYVRQTWNNPSFSCEFPSSTAFRVFCYVTANLYENFRTKSDRKTGWKATENENLCFRTVAFPFAAPKSWGTKAKPGQNRAFQKPALCENFRIVPVKTKRCRRKKIAAYSCFWPQNQSNSYFDLCQKHEKTSPQNKFSRLVMTGAIKVRYKASPYDARKSFFTFSFFCVKTFLCGDKSVVPIGHSLTYPKKNPNLNFWTTFSG